MHQKVTAKRENYYLITEYICMKNKKGEEKR